MSRTRTMLDEIIRWVDRVKPEPFTTRLRFAFEALENRTLLSAAPLAVDFPIEVIAVEFDPNLTAKIGVKARSAAETDGNAATDKDTPRITLAVADLISQAALLSSTGESLEALMRRSGMALEVTGSYTLDQVVNQLEHTPIDFFGAGELVLFYLERRLGIEDFSVTLDRFNLFNLAEFLEEQWASRLPEGNNAVSLFESENRFEIRFRAETAGGGMAQFDAFIETDEPLAPVELEVFSDVLIEFTLVFDKMTGDVALRQDAFYYGVSWDQEVLGGFSLYQRLLDVFEREDVDAYFEARSARLSNLEAAGEDARYFERNPLERRLDWVRHRVDTFPGFASVKAPQVSPPGQRMFFPVYSFGASRDGMPDGTEEWDPLTAYAYAQGYRTLWPEGSLVVLL